MREQTKTAACFGRRGERFLRLALVFACVPLLMHCGGGGTTGGIVPEQKAPVFTPSGTDGNQKDMVTIAYGETSIGSLIRLDVRIGGPTTATDISAFTFDIVFSNSSIIRDVKGVVGDALDNPDKTAVLVSPLVDGRINVGVTQLAGTGNGVGASGATIVSLTFKTEPTVPGTTTLTFGDPKVQDSTGAFITSVTFDAAAASIEQP